MLKKWVALSLIILLIVSGCSQKEELVNEHPTDEGTGPTVEKEEPVQELRYQYPLSGIKTDVEPSSRAIAVMINNHPKARPQSGLQQADVVYEALAEGNVTRFLAIFESEMPERIGPVRSARDYYIELAKGYDSLYIAHGYSPDAKQMLDRGYVDHLNGIRYDGILFERSSDRYAPHNSYISFDNILKGAEENSYPMNTVPDPLSFLDESQLENLTGIEGEGIVISYGDQTFDVQYEYDSETGKYHRYSAGEEMVDADSNEAVSIDNVFIVEMDHEVLDSEGRRAIDLTSGGRGYLLQNGMMNEVEWKNKNGRILPVIDGKTVAFAPGKTWISIVPSLDRVTY